MNCQPKESSRNSPVFKCSRLALLIKIGVLQELITLALQQEFMELRNVVAQTSTGRCCKPGSCRRNQSFFFSLICRIL